MSTFIDVVEAAPAEVASSIAARTTKILVMAVYLSM
jgi:hypothetical protein